MSLDVYLNMKDTQIQRSGSGIFIRENGQTKEITRAEWDEKNPGREPVTYNNDKPDDEVFSANITHNLNNMANEAGIYTVLWRPEEVNITKAKYLIDPLTMGLALLNSDPIRFKKFNSENGWGDYEGFVSFVRDYLIACEKYPDADVRVSR